jgi:hypothetical protein
MIQEQYSRISHHTSSLTGTTGTTFTVPATEDFTNGSWTPFDLALSEIGVDEFQEKVFIRIGNNIKEFNLGTGSTSGSTLWEVGSSGIDSIKAINSTGLDATGDYSIAYGSGTTASGFASHAEGILTIASGSSAHAEGYLTTAGGLYSHAEGFGSKSIGNYSHAEGSFTIASGGEAHAEGSLTVALGADSHAEGSNTLASGATSHAEGSGTIAGGINSHAEGEDTIATGLDSHVEGYLTTASGAYSHAEGNNTRANNFASHSEGSLTLASGGFSHAQGLQTTASGSHSHAEGSFTIASGDNSHAGGFSAVSNKLGEWSRSSNSLGQYGIVSLGQATLDATPTEMFINIGTTTGRFTINNNSAYKVVVDLICIASATNDTKEWGGTFLIKNNGGTTAFVGAPLLVSTFGDAGLATATASCTADDTNDAIIITVTGIAATMNWFAKMEYTEVNA